MTVLLYQTDSYLREFQANILADEPQNRGVTLDRTAFYPGGGGQPCDTGVLISGDDTYKVEKVKKVGEEVVHILDREPPSPLRSATVRAALDWTRRYQLMRTHTALHILCGVVFRDYGAQVTGGDMDPLKGRMDFEFETMRGELVRAIESAVNLEV